MRMRMYFSKLSSGILKNCSRAEVTMDQIVSASPCLTVSSALRESILVGVFGGSSAVQKKVGGVQYAGASRERHKQKHSKTLLRSLETAYATWWNITVWTEKCTFRTEHIQHVLPSEIQAFKYFFTL